LRCRSMPIAHGHSQPTSRRTGTPAKVFRHAGPLCGQAKPPTRECDEHQGDDFVPA
jgi:hypothetical protein